MVVLLDAGAGNPLNVITGNKYQREDDLPALPGVLGLEIVRHYNSAYSKPGNRNSAIGRGWRLSYETELFDQHGMIQILQADGGRVIFDRDPQHPGSCSTVNPANGALRIERKPNSLFDYTWTWTNGRKLHFNSSGKLDRISAPSGEAVELRYDSVNLLVRVTDPQGRALELAYFDAKLPNHFHGVQFIDSPVGRFAYEYGSMPPKASGPFDQAQLLANLVRVRLPASTASTGAVSRLYHHENPHLPWLLTGISVESAGRDGKPAAVRFATYGYDRNGLANLSTHADNVGKVTLAATEGGKTVLTNSLGQHTVYRHATIAGEHRLLEVRGAGCATCGETNVRYGYNNAGQLVETTKLTENGAPAATTRTEFDQRGRTVKVSKIVYQHGRPGPAQWQLRYEYVGGSFAPSVIARPSVVPGRELQTRIDYNDAGQPVRVTDTGWVPTYDGKQAAGTLERSTTYRYAIINGRSLPTRIDGPLPNGKTDSPLDSDVTVFEYDNRSDTGAAPNAASKPDQLTRFDQREGRLSAIISPGNFKRSFEYDAAGRIGAVSDPQGHTSTLRYTPRGKLLMSTRDGITHTMLYDSLDNPVESGYSDVKGYKALARMGYDNAGRNTWTASQLGVVATRRLSTEDQILEASTQSSTIKQTQSYTYDQFGRPLAVTDAGGGIRRIGWNAVGLPDEFTDALGRVTRVGYDAMGNITSIAEAVNMVLSPQQNTETHFELDAYRRPTAVIAPNGATTRYVRDDFGQNVATIGADSGMTTRRFNAAGSVVASTDASGNQAAYEYDVMGRIVLQTISDAVNGGKKTVTAWHYEGMRVVAIDHPDQAERYSYDAHGRMSAKTVILALSGGAHASHTTHYRYDALGQLAGISLPGGGMLDYHRNGQNQITALERNALGESWLRWLLPRQTIVRNLERDVVGLKRLTYGNGVEALYQRSSDGYLARIVYRDPNMPAQSTQRSAALETLLGISPAMAAPATASATATALAAGLPSRPGALGLPPDSKALLDRRYLWDVQGNLLHAQDNNAASSYAYDAHDRLIATASAAATRATVTGFSRYHYDGNGNRLLAQEGLADQSDTRNNTVKTSYASAADRWRDTAGGDAPPVEARYDASGQPDTIGNRTYSWNALGKLLEVRQDQRILASYRYNHRGERIGKTVGDVHTYYLYEDRKLVAELNAKGAVTREYIYMAQQPVAVIDTPNGGQDHGDSGTPLKRFTADCATIWQSWFGNGETTVYLHSNHLGATELATDAKGKPIWQANYSPFGKLTPVGAQDKTSAGASRFELNLRLPGQYADRETGLYYNDHRYYDPERGRYLTPDPLGVRAGTNSYTYVNGNPLKYVDPDGLVLFAFDGTKNDRHDPKLVSNVVKFFNLYQGDKFYITGVGTLDPETGIAPDMLDIDGKRDVGWAYTAKARIKAMMKNLKIYSDTATDDTAFNLDIIGFSRGAAEGRDFANQIIANYKDGYYHYTDNEGKEKCQKMSLNFMGLFDTVLSTHLSSDNYQLGIPDAFRSVVQATALNEYRGAAIAFPLESILGKPKPLGSTRIELGFLGSHSDIGGGFPDGDLAKVAMSWMVDQANHSGLSLKPAADLDSIIASPLMHDKSLNLIHGAEKGGPTATSEDREVRYADGHVERQRATTSQLMTYADTLEYIKYKRNPLSSDEISASVDVARYIDWLSKHGYNIRMTIQ